MQKYLYFTHVDDIKKITESGTIDNRKSNLSNLPSGGYVVDDKGDKIIAYVYKVDEIEKSGCYITYPLDHLGYKTKIKIEKFILNFIPIFKIQNALKIPETLASLSFNVKNEYVLKDMYLYDTNLQEKLYCESVSAEPLIIKDIEIIPVKDALLKIGMTEPYIPFIEFYEKKNSVEITEEYTIHY